MNNMIKVLLVVFISFLSSPSWSETVSIDELVERNGIWKGYYKNGQLRVKGTYKDGNPHGVREWFYENGQLGSKRNLQRRNKRRFLEILS